MNRLKFLFFTFILILFASFHPLSSYKIYTSSYENVLGTSLDMKFSALDEEKADIAEATAINEIERLNRILSSYNENSEFTRWARTNNQAFLISQELSEVLQTFDFWTSITKGKLTPAIGPLDQVWKEAILNQQLPSSEKIDDAIKMINQRHWLVYPKENIAIHLTKTPLILNTFVKAYIINRAVEKVMKIEGVNGVLINIGGDILVKGNINEKISIFDPVKNSDNEILSRTIRVKNKAIATSGNYKRGYDINGKHYSHILNPITGLPADYIKSATIVANDAVIAGALATAFNVMSIEESKLLASQFSNIDYQVITNQNELIESDGWGKLVLRELNPIKKISQKQDKQEKLWNASYEVVINLELAKMQGVARRPFLAIWVANSNNETVKNIALWFNKPRWLPDLKKWYIQHYKNYSSIPQELARISSATRPAGTYTFKWDGKNDKGEWVKQGKYTVFIEVVREHGTYQIMKQELVTNDKEQIYKLDRNTEVANAAVLYRKIP